MIDEGQSKRNIKDKKIHDVKRKTIPARVMMTEMTYASNVNMSKRHVKRPDSK